MKIRSTLGDDHTFGWAFVLIQSEADYAAISAGLLGRKAGDALIN